MAPLPDAGDNKPATTHPEIVKEALDRWLACKDWQGREDQHAREDIKFANADARNSWQWPRAIYESRTGGDDDGGGLPCLTINNTRVHNDIIINTISKNGFGAKVRPVGGKASYKSAQVMQNLIDRVQYISKGSAQRRKVCEQVVDGGIGYMLIETAYVSETSFDQDIFLKASRDPTGVYLDPWIRQPDGLDANFGFIFERMPRKEFNRKYPDYAGKVGAAPLDTMFADWLSDKEVMLAKYYRKLGKSDTLVSFKTEEGAEVEKLASELKEESGEEIYKALLDDIKEGRIEGRTRKVTNNKVHWYLIAGSVIVDDGEWAGKYIPICRCVGRELIIDNTLDRKGNTRSMIDPQRMLNFNASMAVEIVALQPKSAFIAPARSIEGQEQYKTMNINGFPVLLYNDLDDEAPEGAQTIAPPQRLDPPKPSAAHDQGMQTAERHMMMVSGQWQSETGQQSNDKLPESGVAIGQRKEQGETANYHFTEHMADMDRAIGVQLLDLFPKIYDTKRALRIEGDDGKKALIQIDPQQADIVQELQEVKDDEEAVTLAFNPSLGEYECISDPGPSFATQRQEAWNAASMLVQANKEIAACCMDLLMKYGDFPGADEIAERLQKEIKATKPYLFDESKDPQLAAIKQQNERLVALNSELMTKLADEKLKSKGYNEKRDIQAFDSETKRFSAIVDYMAKIMLTPQQMAQMQHDLGLQAHEDIFSMIRESNQEDINREDAEAEAS